MCLIGDTGLKITPGHPIFYEGAWIYPRDKFRRSMQPCSSIYNLVVDRSHIAIVNGVQAILLGHNYTEGILKHDYLGSQRVIEDLKKLPGFQDGLIKLTQDASGNVIKQKSMAQQNKLQNQISMI